MKPKIISFIILSLLLTMGLGSCSKKEFNPEDSITSLLSGEYGKVARKLEITVNDKPLDTKGYIRFDSKYLNFADFRFLDIIPGESTKEFKNIPLQQKYEGLVFAIKYKKKKMVISGVIRSEEMIVNIT